jgi:hypothetical protein
MTSSVLLVLIGVGAAANAVWFVFRFPSLAPKELKHGLIHLFAATVVAQSIVPLAFQLSGDSRVAALGVVFGVGFPALAYIFLSGFWMLKLCQGMLAGHLR